MPGLRAGVACSLKCDPCDMRVETAPTHTRMLPNNYNPCHAPHSQVAQPLSEWLLSTMGGDQLLVLAGRGGGGQDWPWQKKSSPGGLQAVHTGPRSPLGNQPLSPANFPILKVTCSNVSAGGGGGLWKSLPVLPFFRPAERSDRPPRHEIRRFYCFGSSAWKLCADFEGNNG